MSENAWLKQVLADVKTARESRLGLARASDRQVALNSDATRGIQSNGAQNCSHIAASKPIGQQDFSFNNPRP